MRPSGFVGRIFGLLMDYSNAGTFRAARQRLALKRGENVVEIGFGTGKLASLLAADVGQAQVAGADPSPLMVATARRRNPGSDLREGDASRLPWPDAQFDAAVALHCWQFWHDPAHCLAEIRRVMKPNARLVMILRDHSKAQAKLGWLPNPLSRAGDETENLLGAVMAAGFHDVRRDGRVGSSDIVIARNPL
jgi:ubiquinone/menaquinone biosynthesis C-methylase UbiE